MDEAKSCASSLPEHDTLSPLARSIETLCLIAAPVLVVWHLCRFADAPGMLAWWLPVAMFVGALLADFMSGLVHWAADTWGNEVMPFFGKRFLKPFRVHHANPDDLLRRDFVDLNGDVAMINVPVLGGAFYVPLDGDVFQFVAVLLVSFSVTALPTNQIHQWAHMAQPPRVVRWLQRLGLMLSRVEHDKHHSAPFTMNYCITTGWCNRTLTAVRFFPRLERAITALTGITPRSDDLSFVARNDIAESQPAESVTAMDAGLRVFHADRDVRPTV